MHLVKIDLEFRRNFAGIPGPGRIPGGIRWNSGFHLTGIPEYSGMPGPESWSPTEFRVGGTRIPESGRTLGPEFRSSGDQWKSRVQLCRLKCGAPESDNISI